VAVPRRLKLRQSLRWLPLAALVASLISASLLSGDALLWLSWLYFAISSLTCLWGSRVARSAISPVVLVGGQCVVYGAIVPVILTARGLTSLDGVSYASWLPDASSLCALAGGSFGFGFLVSSRRQDRRKPDVAVPEGHAYGRYNRVILPGYILLAAFLMMALYSFNHQVPIAPTSPSAYLLFGPLYLAGTSAFLAYCSPSTVQRLLSLGCLAFSLMIFFYSFIRFTFVITGLACCLLLAWRFRGSTPLISLRWLAVAAAAVFLTVGFLGSRRSALVNDSTVGPGIAQANLESLNIVTPLAAVVATTRASTLLWGKSYYYIVEQVVPHTLWRDKPPPPTLTVISRFANLSEGQSFPIWGEMFLNFDWPGVILGMGLCGYASGKLIRYWIRRRRRRVELDVMAAFVVPLLLEWGSRGYFVAAIYDAFGFLIGPVALTYLYRRKLRRLRAPFSILEGRPAPVGEWLSVENPTATFD